MRPTGGTPRRANLIGLRWVHGKNPTPYFHRKNVHTLLIERKQIMALRKKAAKKSVEEEAPVEEVAPVEAPSDVEADADVDPRRLAQRKVGLRRLAGRVVS